MHTIKLDLKTGFISVDSTLVTVDEKGALVDSIARLCSPPIYTDEGRTRYHFLRKASVFGKSADVIIEIEEGRLYAVAFLFDFIEFFKCSILESKVLKACEKSMHVKFTSNHRSKAFLESCEWGQAIFFYDAKQGDLSLDITFKREVDEPI